MSDNLPVPQRQFPPEVHQSLAELRHIAKSAKSRRDPQLRRATSDELALAESERRSTDCVGHSTRTGLPCRNTRVQGATVCRKHGAATLHIKQKAQRRMLELVMPNIERLNEIAKQTSDPKTLKAAFEAARDLLDRAEIGALAEAKTRASMREATSNQVVVNIGFLQVDTPQAQPIVVTPSRDKR